MMTLSPKYASQVSRARFWFRQSGLRSKAGKTHR